VWHQFLLARPHFFALAWAGGLNAARLLANKSLFQTIKVSIVTFVVFERFGGNIAVY
jgi:hypothetical protein